MAQWRYLRKSVFVGSLGEMADALSIALTGLVAQQQKLAATANNIANAQTAGVVPDPADPSASTVYRPLQVNFLSIEAGGQGAGVRVEVTPDENGYTVIRDPQSVYANDEGLIAVPNVDYAEEFVKIIEIKAAFKANLAVIRTQDEITESLFDITV